MKIEKDESLILKTTITSLILGFFFIVFIVLLIFLIQRNSIKEDSELSIPLSEERLISINQQIEDIKRTEEIRKEGYNLNDKPFENGDYSYDERTVDFRLVCRRDCPVSKDILDQEFAAIAYSVSTIRGLTQSDIDAYLLPFEVHASEDNKCKYGSYLAYKTVFTDSNWFTRGLLCFFFDKIDYDRSKFPYSTSVHEVTHLFEENKVPYGSGEGGSILWEGLSEMLESFFLKGSTNSFCWQGNAWYKQVLKNSNDAHWVGGDLFFELCNQYGFDYDDLPELFSQLDMRKGNIDEQEFVQIINNIVGSDTSQLFEKAGVI